VNLGDQSTGVPPSRMWRLLAAVSGLPFFFILLCFGHPDKGLLATISVGIILEICRSFWRLRALPVFWVAILIYTAIHATLVFVADFTYKPFIILYGFPIVIVDYAIMYFGLVLVERRFLPKV